MIKQPSIVRSFAAGLALLFLSACAHEAPTPELDLHLERFPLVAAEYRTTRTLDGPGHAQKIETLWRFWRDADRIVTENLSAHSGEIWQRDGSTLFHQKLFHDDRKSIEYQMDDLQMIGALLSWSHQALLVSPEVLSSLKLKRAGWRQEYPYRRYAGEVDGSTWDITIRMDLLLPVAIERTTNHNRERTELVALSTLVAAPWAPASTEGYERIDFADLGDRQSDPFVVRFQEQLGPPHTH